MELPPNISQEVSLTSLSLPKQSPNIKERLHLHVKRRLHNEAPLADETPVDTREPPNVASNRKQPTKKQPKPHKPNRKRPAKAAMNSAVHMENESDPGDNQRKNKRLLKQASHSVAPSGSLDAVSSPGQSDRLSAFGDVAHLVGGDDDGSQEGCEMSTDSKLGGGSRDKDKSPDILGLVLNVKKDALLRDPQVQDFLNKIIKAVKDYTDC